MTDIAAADQKQTSKAAQKKAKKDEGFLSLRNSIKTYDEDDLDRVFKDMHDTLLGKAAKEVADGTRCPEKFEKEVVRDFRAAASGVGTHTARLSRTTAAMPTLSVTPPGQNQPGRNFYAGNSAVAGYVKVIKRPISISGQDHEKSFADRIIEGDEHLDDLRRSFARAFGPDALKAVEEALAARHMRQGGVEVHHENYPVVFIPGPQGDMQASFMSSIEAYDLMNAMRMKGWQDVNARKAARAAKKDQPDVADAADKDAASDAAEADQEHIRILPWLFSRSIVSGKIRNAALNVFDTRTRFRVRLPDQLTRMSAEIWAFIEKDGAFPRMRDPWAVNTLEFYADRLEEHLKPGAHVTREMEETLNDVADRLIDAGMTWRAEVAAELVARGHDAEVSASALDLLRTLPVHKDKRPRLFGSLLSSHFSSRLSLKGEA